MTKPAGQPASESKVSRPVRDSDFAARLAKACDLRTGCPPLHRGRLVWIRQKLESDFNENVSLETVRKWLSGEAKPRPEKTRMLAALLGVDLAWLQIGMGEGPMPVVPEAGPLPSRRHPLFGAMKGTFTIAEGVDLTEPADPEWADLAEKKAREWKF